LAASNLRVKMSGALTFLKSFLKNLSHLWKKMNRQGFLVSWCDYFRDATEMMAAFISSCSSSS
jgi:hypothetical protein